MSVIKAVLEHNTNHFSVPEDISNYTYQELQILADRVLSPYSDFYNCLVYMGPMYTDKYKNTYTFPATNFYDLVCFSSGDNTLCVATEDLHIMSGRRRIGAILV